MTELLHRRNKTFQRQKESTYYDVDNIQSMLSENDDDELWTECNEISQFNVEANNFADKYPNYTI